MEVSPSALEARLTVSSKKRKAKRNSERLQRRAGAASYKLKSAHRLKAVAADTESLGTSHSTTHRAPMILGDRKSPGPEGGESHAIGPGQGNAAHQHFGYRRRGNMIARAWWGRFFFIFSHTRGAQAPRLRALDIVIDDGSERHRPRSVRRRHSRRPARAQASRKNKIAVGARRLATFARLNNAQMSKGPCMTRAVLSRA
jgi:hypothetical protein